MKNDIRRRKYENGEIIPLTFNFMFTGIFNDVKNIDIVESFLAIYFNRDISEIRGNVEIKSRDLSIEKRLEKNKQVDLILDIDGEKINIEVANSMTQGVIDRNVVYGCKIHAGQLEYGDNNYSGIKNTIQICLNNFPCNSNKFVDSYYLQNDDNKILSHKFRIDFVDLDKAVKKLYNDNEENLARFCKAMTCQNIKDLRKEIGDIMDKNTKEKLIDEVQKYSQNDEVVALYSAYSREELERNTFRKEVREQAVKDALEEAIKRVRPQVKAEVRDEVKAEVRNEVKAEVRNEIKAEVRDEIRAEAKDEVKNKVKEEQIKIAKNLLKANMSISNIAKVTGISEKEIKKFC